MSIHTVDTYKKSFTFPQIAHNDYAVEQFEALSVAEQNLNNDPSNDTSYENFIKVSNEVASNLKRDTRTNGLTQKTTEILLASESELKMNEKVLVL